MPQPPHKSATKKVQVNVRCFPEFRTLARLVSTHFGSDMSKTIVKAFKEYVAVRMRTDPELERLVGQAYKNSENAEQF